MADNEQCLIHSDMLSRMDERVKEIHKWMVGNGQPGAAGRLVALETQVADIRKPKQWPAVLAALCAVITVIVNFYYNCK